jgi:TolB protein
VFDLTVMGFKEVAPDAAHYVLAGSGGGSVQAQLSFDKKPIFSKIYSGVNERAQAHRLADDVVQQVTGKKGIAETKIAFKSNNGHFGEIYVSDFDGYNRQAVTRDNVDVAAPCWVPGKLALYYTSYKLGNPDIFAHYGGMNSSAAVSPDGQKVAMILSKTGSPNVFVCDADGSGLKELTTTSEASSPCWSPDGRWICFAARVNGRMSLYKVPSVGGEMERIATDGVSRPSEPDWSPDGHWIAFTSQVSTFQVCVVPAAGGRATPIVSGEDPSWSANSRTLVFVRRGSEGNRMLSLLDVPTKQVKDAARVSGSNSGISQPSWAR